VAARLTGAITLKRESSISGVDLLGRRN
jgi:hypothetical protein